MEEISTGPDTVWVLRYRPKRGRGLSGLLYIHSAGYAISRFIGEATDTALHHTTRIEHASERVAGRWFPAALNYVIRWQGGASTPPVHLAGSARIDSVFFLEEGAPSSRFDAAHPLRIEAGAAVRADSFWSRLRPEPLTSKEARTFPAVDSLMAASGLQGLPQRTAKLAEGLFTIGPVDADLRRFYAYNPWEGSRWGLGLQTGDSVSRRLVLGGWAGYGSKDKAWKYGAFLEARAGRYRETVLRVSYTHDLRDPGRVSIHRDADRTYLRQFLLQRVDQSEAWEVALRFRQGYLQTEVAARAEHLTPLYAYALVAEGVRQPAPFRVQEGVVSLRYALRERSAPAFGRYTSVGTDHPVLYGRYTAGSLRFSDGAAGPVRYTQATVAATWQTHILGVGRERFLLHAGASWSSGPLPLSKLFAGRGFRAEGADWYVFGGLLTARPYDYYTEWFVSFHWRHDFDWRIFHTARSAPQLGFGYNGLIGTLHNRGAHTDVDFSVPARPHHEAGVLLSDLVQLPLLRLYRLSLGAGYFLHLRAAQELKRDGVGVLNFGLEI